MENVRLAAVFMLLFLVSLSAVHAQQVVPPSPGAASSGSSLFGALSSGNSTLYAGFFAIMLFVVFSIALNRTQLSSGRVAISLTLSLMVFFVLYSNSVLLGFLLNAFVILIFIAFILGILALLRSPRVIKLPGLIIVLFLVYILFSTNSSLSNSVDSALHISILQILPMLLGAVSAIVFIVLMIRGIKTRKNMTVRVIMMFAVFLLITLLIPGFAGFLFSPVTFAVILAVIIAVIMLARGRKGVKLSKQDKADLKLQKASAFQAGVLSKIQERQEGNKQILKEYKNLSVKGNLSQDEQLRMNELKKKLTESAWQNVSDRAELTKRQYSKSELSNNPDLQRLTSGFFSKKRAVKSLMEKAQGNHRLSRSEKRALKTQQKTAGSAGATADLLQPAKPLSEKKARKLYEKRISKETRGRDVSAVIRERQKLLDPALGLSGSTRRKLLKKIDKRLDKMTGGKFTPHPPEESSRKEIAAVQRQQAAGDGGIAQARLEAARRNAALEEQRRLSEQAMMAEAAREEKSRQEMIKEQSRLADAAKREEASREGEEAPTRKEFKFFTKIGRREEERERPIKEEKNERMQEKPKEEKPGASEESARQPGPSSALDRRIKPPLFFSRRSPVDEEGKLDVQVQREIEVNGLTHRREELLNGINSGSLSGKELKDARNEVSRIDYRLKRYGRDIHR